MEAAVGPEVARWRWSFGGEARDGIVVHTWRFGLFFLAVDVPRFFDVLGFREVLLSTASIPIILDVRLGRLVNRRGRL